MNCVMPHSKTTVDAMIGGAYICRSHYQRIEKALVDIAVLHRMLGAMLEPGSQGKFDEAEPRRGGQGEPPAPIRLDAVVLRDPRSKWADADGHSGPRATISVVSSWARLVREERELSDPLTTPTVETEVHLLVDHLEWVVRQAYVDEFASEVNDALKALQRVTAYVPERVRVGSCPQQLEDGSTCGGPLYATPTGDARCGRCNTVHDVAEHQVATVVDLIYGQPNAERSERYRRMARQRWTSQSDE